MDLARSVFDVVVSFLGGFAIAGWRCCKQEPHWNSAGSFLFGIDGVGVWKAEEARSMEGGIVPNAALGIELHFPSQCSPEDQLAVRMEKLQKHGGQLGADCSTDEAAARERSTVYRTASWPGLTIGWAWDLDTEGRKLGEPPKCGETGSAEGSKLPPMKFLYFATTALQFRKEVTKFSF